VNAPRRSRLHAVAVVSVATAVVLTSATGGAATGDSRRRLPPSSRKELVRVLGPKVAPLGLHITRAALVDTDNRRSANGTHLALYVEPDGAYSPAEYLAGTATVSRVFLPLVFDRWPGLRSFDVCQEPPPEVDDRPEPAPETQVFVRRGGRDAVDWQNADLAELLAQGVRASNEAGGSKQVKLSVFVAKHLQTIPEYKDAFDRATAELQTQPSSSTQYR
jgi:hypothetical protein